MNTLDMFQSVELAEKNEKYKADIIKAFETAKRYINTDKDPYSEYCCLAKRAQFDGQKKYIEGIDPNLKEMAMQAGLWLRNNHPIERCLRNLSRSARDQGLKLFSYKVHPNAPRIQSL